MLIRGVDIAGPEDARGIVFLHGASYTRKAWLPQMRALAGEFRVIAADLPGHGEFSDEPFDFAAAVANVADVIKHRTSGRVVLVGASLGGCVAMEVAHQYPGQICGLVIAGATFDASTLLCRLVLFGESITFPRIEPRLTRHFQAYVRRSLEADMADEMVAAGCYWRAAADAVSQLSGRDFLTPLRSFDGPTLIINGQRDVVHRYYERAFANAAKDVVVEVLPEANHVCNLDKPDEFTALVRKFARSCFPVAVSAGE